MTAKPFTVKLLLDPCYAPDLAGCWLQSSVLPPGRPIHPTILELLPRSVSTKHLPACIEMPFSILRFPNEILLNIISRVLNTDIEKFASTCKTIHGLATDALRAHRERKRVYRSITYGAPKDEKAKTTWIHPTLMLRDLIYKDLLCYPIELHINDRNYEGAEWDDGRIYDQDGDPINTQSEIDVVLSSFPEYVELLIDACPHFACNEELKREILEEGDIGTTLGLIMALLPNLGTLHVTDYNDGSDGIGNLREVLDSVLVASQAPDRASENICDLPTDAPMGAPHRTDGVEQALSRLRHVTFTRSDEGRHRDNWDLSMWAPLFFLPSMVSVHADHINTSEETWNLPEFRSNIESFSSHRSTLDAKSIATYLEGTRNLREFELVTETLWSNGLRFGEVVQQLECFAGHSLQYLQLDVSCSWNGLGILDGDLFIGSLKHFQSLTTVKLGGPVFIAPPDPDQATCNGIVVGPSASGLPISSRLGGPRTGKICKAIDLFPPSIERVIIVCVILDSWSRGQLDIDILFAILQDLPMHKSVLLPGLESITFKIGRCATIEKEHSSLFRACGEAGVKIFNQVEAGLIEVS